jgi:hypothetical protein
MGGCDKVRMAFVPGTGEGNQALRQFLQKELRKFLSATGLIVAAQEVPGSGVWTFAESLGVGKVGSPAQRPNGP